MAQNGTIFYWYCSRAISSYSKDVHCGDIILNDNAFHHNQIRPNYDQFYDQFYAGSLMLLRMDTEFQFNFQIENCNITQHIGPIIYIENDNVKSNNDFTMDIYNNTTLFGNQSIPDELFSSTLIIEKCSFIDNIYYAPGSIPARLSIHVSTIISIVGMNSEIVKNIEYGGVNILIKDSYIKGTQGSARYLATEVILSADYVPRIDIENSQFVSNIIPSNSNGLFYIKVAEYINIIDSLFIGNNTAGVMKIDNDYDDYILKIKGSKFIDIFGGDDRYNRLVSHFSLGCFPTRRCKNGARDPSHKGEVIIEDTTFHNSMFKNSGFAISSADVTITNTIITRNFMYGSTALGGTNVDDLYGFISVLYGNITVYNVTATNNWIEQKGLLYTQNGMITIVGGNFNDNIGMLLSAEIIYITKATFIRNQNYFGGGSVIRTEFIYDENSVIMIEESEFTNNSAFFPECMSRPDIVNITHTDTICGNFYGGALYVKYGYVKITNCVIIGNKAPSGGFAWIGQGSTLTIMSSVIKWNSANAFGGFIALDSNASLNMNTVNSSDNAAGYAGGVIFGMDSNIIILNECRFTNNSASLGWGGAIYLYKGNLLCDRCISEDNDAKHGSFIFPNYSHVDLKSSSVSNYMIYSNITSSPYNNSFNPNKSSIYTKTVTYVCSKFNSTNMQIKLIHIDQVTSIPIHKYLPAEFIQKTLFCNTSCYVYCDDASCFGSSITFQHAETALLDCNGAAACIESNIFISASESFIWCHQTASCQEATININQTNNITVHCISSLACNMLRIAINNTNHFKIICYQLHSCDSIRIYSDTDSVQIVSHNYNQNVVIYIPSDPTPKNFNCNPRNAYFMSTLTSRKLESLWDRVDELFPHNPPCYGITFHSTKTHAECQMNYQPLYHYTYKILYYPNTCFEQYMNCAPALFLNDFPQPKCISTSLKPTAQPTSSPTSEPTLSPTSISLWAQLENVNSIDFIINITLSSVMLIYFIIIICISIVNNKHMKQYYWLLIWFIHFWLFFIVAMYY
eukprot:59762_1